MSDVPEHVPVLKRETIEAIGPQSGGLYVDATFGAGGHTQALLEAAPGATVIAIDRDRDVLLRTAERLSQFGERLRVIHGKFGDIAQLLQQAAVGKVDGIMADLGISSMQLADADRGMSFRADGPLDMRMDRTRGETALELIESLDQEELADVIFRYGEERRSRRVARCIKQAQGDGRLQTTLDLRKAVVRAVGPARVGGVDPATRTFQALRIAVNGELDELGQLLESAPEVLAPAGVLAIISFHSLEDRMVKRAFQDRERWEAFFKKPVCASPAETHLNPRSRSAKMRAARLRSGDLLPAEAS
ncbi:MAG: 16S rRNA (cytosine(1402)-N(4))-methyltransferase RsmH [Deltaproteobacteria bacterium]|nr:16S rRNA (cytosine(1402)-N(4))-methyltransferase RsmH [Deltaproteobacteria bacterium]